MDLELHSCVAPSIDGRGPAYLYVLAVFAIVSAGVAGAQSIFVLEFFPVKKWFAWCSVRVLIGDIFQG